MNNNEKGKIKIEKKNNPTATHCRCCGGQKHTDKPGKFYNITPLQYQQQDSNTGRKKLKTKKKRLKTLPRTLSWQNSSKDTADIWSYCAF